MFQQIALCVYWTSSLCLRLWKKLLNIFLIMMITAWKVLCLFHAIYYPEVKGRREQKGNSLEVWLKFHVGAPAKKYIWRNTTTI